MSTFWKCIHPKYPTMALLIFIMLITTSTHHSFTRNMSKKFSLFGGFHQKSFSSPQNSVVTSDSNEKIKLFRSLKLKKNRDYENLILLEGFRWIFTIMIIKPKIHEVVLFSRQINDALNFGIVPKHILISERFLPIDYLVIRHVNFY